MTTAFFTRDNANQRTADRRRHHAIRYQRPPVEANNIGSTSRQLSTPSLVTYWIRTTFWSVIACSNAERVDLNDAARGLTHTRSASSSACCRVRGSRTSTIFPAVAAARSAYGASADTTTATNNAIASVRDNRTGGSDAPGTRPYPPPEPGRDQMGSPALSSAARSRLMVRIDTSNSLANRSAVVPRAPLRRRTSVRA